MATITWTGFGNDNYWDNGANWDSGNSPTAGDDVIISGAAAAYVNAQGNNGVPDSIQSLTLSQRASVTFTSGLESLNITGNLRLNDASLVRIGDNAGAIGALHFRNNAATISGTGSILFGTASNQLTFASTVSTDPFTIGAGVQIGGTSGSIVVAGTNSLVNQGIISASVPGGTITVQGGRDWTNSGTIQVSAGSLRLAGDHWTNLGTIQVTGGELNLVGTFQMQEGILGVSGGTFSRPDGAGTVNLALGGILDNVGRTTTFDSTTGSWNQLSGSRIRGGLITAAAGFALVVQQGQWTGVTIDGSGGSVSPVDMQSTSSSSLTVTGELTLANGAQLNLGNAAGSTTGVILGQEDTVAAQGFSLRGNGTITMGTSTNNRIDAFGGTRPLVIDPGVTVAGSRTIVASSDVINNGTISLAGTVLFRSFAGVRNKLVNNGTINVGGAGAAGVLAVTDGDFQQSSTGILNLEISNTTTFDRLVVSAGPYALGGVAILGGRLNVTLLGPAPPPGSSFRILSYASGTGQFDTIDLPPSFVTQFDATGLEVTNP